MTDFDKQKSYLYKDTNFGTVNNEQKEIIRDSQSNNFYKKTFGNYLN